MINSAYCAASLWRRRPPFARERRNALRLLRPTGYRDDSMLAKSAEPQTYNRPSWFAAGMPHIWLPYAQMKIAGDPLPVVATRGSRIVLADGRELIDGIASWWTACHGYNHPHI